MATTPGRFIADPEKRKNFNRSSPQAKRFMNEDQMSKFVNKEQAKHVATPGSTQADQAKRQAKRQAKLRNAAERIATNDQQAARPENNIRKSDLGPRPRQRNDAPAASHSQFIRNSGVDIPAGHRRPTGTPGIVQNAFAWFTPSPNQTDEQKAAANKAFEALGAKPNAPSPSEGNKDETDSHTEGSGAGGIAAGNDAAAAEQQALEAVRDKSGLPEDASVGRFNTGRPFVRTTDSNGTPRFSDPSTFQENGRNSGGFAVEGFDLGAANDEFRRANQIRQQRLEADSGNGGQQLPSGPSQFDIEQANDRAESFLRGVENGPADVGPTRAQRKEARAIRNAPFNRFATTQEARSDRIEATSDQRLSADTQAKIQADLKKTFATEQGKAARKWAEQQVEIAKEQRSETYNIIKDSVDASGANVSVADVIAVANQRLDMDPLSQKPAQAAKSVRTAMRLIGQGTGEDGFLGNAETVSQAEINSSLVPGR